MNPYNTNTGDVSLTDQSTWGGTQNTEQSNQGLVNTEYQGTPWAANETPWFLNTQQFNQNTWDLNPSRTPMENAGQQTIYTMNNANKTNNPNETSNPNKNEIWAGVLKGASAGVLQYLSDRRRARVEADLENQRYAHSVEKMATEAARASTMPSIKKAVKPGVSGNKPVGKPV